jgi:hypothetical protein
MKSLIAVTAVLAGALSANAIVFTPTPADLGDLDHHNATTWGITWSVPAGEQITGATLTFKNIWDWQREDDRLYIHLLDDPKTGVVSVADNTADNVFSDYFANQGRYLMTWTDPNGGAPTGFDLVYNFTAADLTTLKAYLSDSHGIGYADFGFGLDPDCHYFNDGVSFEIKTQRVPEGGSSAILMGLGLLGLAPVRCKVNSTPALAEAKA